MPERDPYDVTVAFDDIYGGESSPDTYVVTPSQDTAKAFARAIWHRAASRRLAPPPIDFEVLGSLNIMEPLVVHDWSRSARARHRMYGVSSTPIFDELEHRFTVATPVPKVVRLDTEESYAEFRKGRRAPYIKRLGERMRALEAAMARHSADNHGGGRVAALEDAFEEHMRDYHGEDVDVLGEVAVRALGEVVHGGAHVPLPVPSWAKGKVDCWQDGPEILCTVRLCAPDGTLRFATTGVPFKQAAEEVFVCAELEGEEIDENVEPALVEVVQVVGAASLPAELCKVAPEIFAKSDGGCVVGIARPLSDPRMCAAMALLQRCQRGDRLACAEVAHLARAGESEFLTDAAGRLAVGQREKAERLAARGVA